MKADTANGPTASCDHAPTKVLVVPGEYGYKVRCLGCGTLGPERESPEAAWAALMGRRHRRRRSREAGSDG